MMIKKNDLRKQSIQNAIEFLSSIPGTSQSKENDKKQIDNLQSIIEDLDKNPESQGSRHLIWPYSTRNGSLRTIPGIIDITDRISRGENMNKTEKKGFTDGHFFSTCQISISWTIYPRSICIPFVMELSNVLLN